eukprot:EG_transcript_2052
MNPSLAEFKQHYEEQCRQRGTEVLPAISLLSESSTNHHLSVLHQAIGEKNAVTLSNALRGNNYFQVIELVDAYIGDVGVAALCDALQGNRSVHTLVLRGNNIRAEGAIAISRLLQRSSTLAVLSLEWNSIGSSDAGVASLASALQGNRTLRSLDLRNNKLSPNAGQVLANMLKYNDCLQCLDVRWNKVGGLAGRAFNEALALNSTLTELPLAGNEVEFSVVKEIEQKLEENKCRRGASSPYRSTQVASPLGPPPANSQSFFNATAHSLFQFPPMPSSPPHGRVRGTRSTSVSGLPGDSEYSLIDAAVRKREKELQKEQAEWQEAIDGHQSQMEHQKRKLEMTNEEMAQRLWQSEEALRKCQQQLHDAELSSEQRVRELEGLVARLQDSVRAMEAERKLAEDSSQLSIERQKLLLEGECERQKQTVMAALEREKLQLQAALEKCRVQAEQERLLWEQKLRAADQFANLTEEQRQAIDQERVALEQQKAALEAQVLKAESRQLKQEAVIEQLKAELEGTRAEKQHQLRLASSKAEDDVQRLKAGFEVERRRWQMQHETEVETRDAKFRLEADALRSEEGLLKQKLRDREAELKVLQDEVGSMRQVMESKVRAVTEALQAEADRLKQEADVLKRKITGLSAESAEHLSRADKNEDAAKEHQRTIAKLKQNTKDLEGELERTRTQLDLHERQIASLEDQLAAEKRNTAAVQGQIKDTKLEYEKEVVRVKAVAAKEREDLCLMYQGQLKELEEVVKAKDAQLAMAREEKDNCVTHYQRQLQEQEERLRRQAEERTRQDIALGRLENVLAEKTAEGTRLQFTVEEGRKSRQALEEQIAALKASHQAKVEELCSQHSEALRDKEAQLQQKRDKILSLENESRALTDRNRFLRDNAQRQHERLQHRVVESVKAIFEDRTYIESATVAHS